MPLATQAYDIAAMVESPPPETSHCTRFRVPMTDDSIDKLITLNVPEETRKSTRWDTKVWRNWAAF